MSSSNHDGIVTHCLRFPEVVDKSHVTFEGPSSADIWRFGPGKLEFDKTGPPTYRSDAWGGISLHKSRDAAEEVASDRVGVLPFYRNAVEAWTALAMPVTHRGEVNWRGRVESNNAILAAKKAPRGPLAVITTAGFSDQSPVAAEHQICF